ncbi:MAG: DUF5655 domain-containing protein [Natronosporangium sp.]
MPRWTCPACDREFAAAGQAHVCVPGGTVADTFAGRPAYQLAAYQAMADHLGTLGPVHVDAVRVGVFLRRVGKFAEVRPKARSLQLALWLPRTVDHPRVARQIRVSAGQTVHMVKLTAVEDVDDQVRAWLTESYLAADG